MTKMPVTEDEYCRFHSQEASKVLEAIDTEPAKGDFVFRGTVSVLQDQELLGVCCMAVRLDGTADRMLTDGQDGELYAMWFYHSFLCVCLFFKVGSQEAGTWR